MLQFVIIVVRDDSQDNGCCSSMLLNLTMFSTDSALEETAAITDGAEEIYSLNESSCRLTANLVIRKYHSANESKLLYSRILSLNGIHIVEHNAL